MIKADANNEVGTVQVEDLGTLQRRVTDLVRIADAATQTYDRTAWIRYGAIWVPIPFAVLLFRLDLQVWHYYLAGALFLVVALAMYAMDLVAVEKRDRAIQAVQRAQEACEVARFAGRPNALP